MNRLQDLNGRPLAPSVNLVPMFAQASGDAYRMLVQSQISDPKKHFDAKLVAKMAVEYASEFVQEFERELNLLVKAAQNK